MSVWVGTSGYAYAHWRGVLYPADLPPRRWLAHYAAAFEAVELNVTFYRLPRASAFEAWRQGTPAGFRFAVKGSRFITHLKRLGDAGEALATFFEPVRRLGPKLAAVLWQLPPRFRADPDRLDRFLSQAARAAGRVRRAGPVRHALEFRDRSWFNEAVYEVLRRHDAALVLADAPFEVVTAPLRAAPGGRLDTVRVPVVSSWMYLRRHGSRGDGRLSYTEAELRRDAEAIAAWARRGDVFVFFNNDYAGHAVRNAATLQRLVGALMAG
ncbi:MAG: DUF72 domain-containing protein [Armatimonadota bacterium]|nr:DUF72 domain-containing protein [Armatimonadota bacterium]